VLESGVRAAGLADAVQGRDVIVLAIPFGVAGTLAGLFTSVPAETVVIDTSNYYPHINGQIEAVDNGQVESVWNARAAGAPRGQGVERRPGRGPADHAATPALRPCRASTSRA
jgi:8-hydroxy-5-deazaflavin:NADPH oxidoreductase